MSVDLSAPEIRAAHQQILDKADPTTWFILSYGSPPSALQLVASGPAPPLPQIRDLLAATAEDVLFGYAEIGGKGLIVAFMKDNVGGVRRARAVVHSRAVASLFPDYAALITVAHPSQLSDEDVADKLGLNLQQSYDHPSNPSHPVATPDHDQRYPDNLGKRTPTHLALARQSSPASSSPVEPSPPVPEKDHPLSASQTFPAASGSRSTTSLASQGSQRSRISSKRSEPSTPKLQRELQLAGERADDSITSAPLHHQAASHSRDHLDKMTTPSGKPSPLPLAPPTDTTPTSHYHSRVVSAPVHSHSPIEHKGIASTDVFPDSAQRNRKTSLTSRLGQLGHAFGRGSPKSPKSPSTSSPSAGGVFGHSNGHSAPTPSSPKEAKSPGSPSLARFMNSNLARNFGRRASGGPTPPISPGAAYSGRESVPPPPPPKDIEESVVTYTPPAGSSGASSASRKGEEDLRVRDDTRGLLGVQADQDVLARSNSGQRALSEASQKRLKDESEIQEKFRRDEEERARARQRQRDSVQSIPAASGQHEDEDEDEDGGVDGILDRYTRDSVYVDSRKNGLPDADNEPVPAVDRRYESEEEDFGLPYDRPDPDSPLQPRRRLPVPPSATIPVLGLPIGQSHHGSPEQPLRGSTRLADPAPVYDDHTAPESHASRLTTPSASYYTPVREASTPGAVEDEAREIEPHQGLTKDVGEDESVTERFMEMDMAEEGHAGGKAVEMSMLAEEHAREEQNKRDAGQESRAREAEDHRTRLREEYMQREQERAAETRRLEEEAVVEETRRVEQAKREEQERAMAQRKREEEFQAEEERRVREQAEEEQRREEERLAEARRQEEERLAEERRLEEERAAVARRQEEERIAEEQRREAERVEAERKRKEETLASLNRGKESGGVMLSGWITVQTSKSMIWRRRWFNFYGHEIKLFKSELDSKPIQTVPLGSAVHISHTYEESQVQGSFKVRDQSGEEWYMFTDGSEEKETVLAAFAIASA